MAYRLSWRSPQHWRSSSEKSHVPAWQFLHGSREPTVRSNLQILGSTNIRFPFWASITRHLPLNNSQLDLDDNCSSAVRHSGLVKASLRIQQHWERCSTCMYAPLADCCWLMGMDRPMRIEECDTLYLLKRLILWRCWGQLGQRAMKHYIKFWTVLHMEHMNSRAKLVSDGAGGLVFRGNQLCK